MQSWRPGSLFDHHIGDALCSKVNPQTCSQCFPNLQLLSRLLHREPHGELQRRCLNELTGSEARRLLRNRDESQRQNLDLSALWCRKEQDFIGAPDDTNHWERTPTWARIGADGNTIAHLVADDGLDPISQVRHQYGMGKLARRHGMIVCIDWFQKVPITIDMQLLVFACKGQAPCFGGAIIVANGTAKGSRYLLTYRRGEGFTCGIDQHRVNV